MSSVYVRASFGINKCALLRTKPTGFAAPAEFTIQYFLSGWHIASSRYSRQSPILCRSCACIPGWANTRVSRVSTGSRSSSSEFDPAGSESVAVTDSSAMRGRSSIREASSRPPAALAAEAIEQRLRLLGREFAQGPPAEPPQILRKVGRCG